MKSLVIDIITKLTGLDLGVGGRLKRLLSNPRGVLPIYINEMNVLFMRRAKNLTAILMGFLNQILYN